MRSGSTGCPPPSRARAGSDWMRNRPGVRAFVAAQGWTLVAEHSDIASGKDDRRPGFPGGACPVSPTGRGAGRGPAGPDNPACAHAVAAAGGRLLGSRGGHAGCGRPDDAHLRRDGAEGTRADQRSHTSGAGGSKGARGGAGRRSRVSAHSGAVRGACGHGAGRECRPGSAPALAGGRAAQERGRVDDGRAGASFDRARGADAARQEGLDAYDSVSRLHCEGWLQRRIRSSRREL